MNNHYEECIRACQECLEACNHCFSSCLEESNPEMMKMCIRLDRECADICQLAITAMQTSSPHLKEICNLCATICAACGEECSKHELDHCQECAKACFNCAEVCRKMVS